MTKIDEAGSYGGMRPNRQQKPLISKRFVDEVWNQCKKTEAERVSETRAIDPVKRVKRGQFLAS